MALTTGGVPLTPEEIGALRTALGIPDTPVTTRYTSLMGTDDAIFLRGGAPGLASATVVASFAGSGGSSPVSVSHNGVGEYPTAGDTATAELAPGWSGSLQWTRDGIDIVGETRSTYLLTVDDAGAEIAVRVSGMTFSSNSVVAASGTTAPAAFTSGQWTATAGAESIVVNITSLPSDGGSAITALEYRLNGGSAVALTGTGTGERTITGLTAAVEYDVELRAVNANGNGAWGDLKSATPTAASGAALVQRTNVARGANSNPTASFSSDVTAGNTLVIFAGMQNDTGTPTVTVTTSQSDTVVTNVHQIGSSQFRTLLGYVASANGGPTTVTLSGLDHSSIYVEEWENISYDSSAGVGQVFGTLPQTASTPNSSTVADGVSFTVLSAWTGSDIDSVVVPSGWTEGGRYTGGPGFAGYGQVIGAYRIESATGVKSAAWLDPGSAEYVGVQVFTFSQT